MPPCRRSATRTTPSIRGDLAIGTAGLEATLPLDSFFGLNKAMTKFYADYKAGTAAIVHAAASPYRERSHFDGQDTLETGMTGPRAAETGWLNRAAMVLPVGDKAKPIIDARRDDHRAADPARRGADPHLDAARLQTRRHRYARAAAGPLRDDRPRARQGVRRGHAGRHARRRREHGQARRQRRRRRQQRVTASFVQLAEGAGRLLADPPGPRLAAISYDGWDTHAAEGAGQGRLAGLLTALDASLDALKKAMAPVWGETAVVVITEFGRTAHINGTDGTDHGTATTALLMGGAIKGGRVIADWPGLKSSQLYQQRDLAPTTDLRAVLKGMLRDHLGISETALATTVFPGSIGVKPMDGLIA